LRILQSEPKTGSSFVIRPATIAFLTGLLPIIAAHAAYLLNVVVGTELATQYVCMPYLDGCVSISRATRSGPGLHLFQAIMLPSAILLLFSWEFLREWLLGLKASTGRRVWTISGLGMIGAFSLVFYATFLGTEGEWYRWLRRYGVIFYFGGIALAQLLLVWVLWPVRHQLVSGRLTRPIAILTTLVSLQWTLGVFSAMKRLIFNDPDFIARLENMIEWCYALPMSAGFIVIAWMFSRTGADARLRLRD
jgi:hypothetical protein